MSHDHWFDRLLKVMASDATRRQVVGRALTLSGAWLFGGGTGASAAAKPAHRCGKRLCAANFKTRKQRRRCEAKCGRCRVRSKFCVAGPDLAHPDVKRHATCCRDGQKCCQDTFQCCIETHTCCPAAHVSAGKVSCCPGACCLESPSGCCARGQRCCPGVGCVDRDECPGDPDPGDPGGSDCPDGNPRCAGQCCQSGTSCFGSGEAERCCPADFIPAPCTFADGSVCVSNDDYVCCEGNGHARTPPEDYWCLGQGPTAAAYLATDFVRNHPDAYPPVSIHHAS